MEHFDILTLEAAAALAGTRDNTIAAAMVNARMQFIVLLDLILSLSSNVSFSNSCILLNYTKLPAGFLIKSVYIHGLFRRLLR